MVMVDKIFTISELANEIGYQAHVLRYYEKEFDLDIPRNQSNHRYYTIKEVEIFNYIKSLQEKGFSNKQIKLILKSPEVIVENSETAITLTREYKESEISKNNFNEIFFLELEEILKKTLSGHNDLIENLRREIVELRNEFSSKERDVLICENAKLKMKVKEKSYQVADLKSKLNRAVNKPSFIGKIFKSNK